ncbi:HNH endonuclease [Saccharothrix deserti]|uniref:HNH endonuclease n=1 Tax=Saccharothrix deserti TaxID=2593674 RepID=UPI00131E4624|nr:HNH endonuclease [Saccharothrix deserti]
MGEDVQTDEQRGAWLMLAVGDDRPRRSNDGYDDAPAAHYSWDSSVLNHQLPQAGDVIVLWNKKVLLGASVIEKIVVGEEDKAFHRCPYCGRATIELRKTAKPPYRCTKCTGTFEVAEVVTIRKDVTTYRSHHEVAWVDLTGELTSDRLRGLCTRPKSQLSIRQLDYARFQEAVRAAPGRPSLSPVEAALATTLRGGHTTAVVRVRRGQGAFRSHLLKEYGDKCAFTGPTPHAALEAAHLNSFAADGRHHDQGGLLLRRDVHRLFDLGHLAVDPQDHTIDVSEAIGCYPEYRQLQGEKLHVELTTRQEGWIAKHWAMHRS